MVSQHDRNPRNCDIIPITRILPTMGSLAILRKIVVGGGGGGNGDVESNDTAYQTCPSAHSMTSAPQSYDMPSLVPSSVAGTPTIVPLSIIATHCAHFYLHGMCRRGSTCLYIHAL
eukprot:PhF_6_TR26943/c0_g1_i1/m.39285